MPLPVILHLRQVLQQVEKWIDEQVWGDKQKIYMQTKIYLPSTVLQSVIFMPKVK